MFFDGFIFFVSYIFFLFPDLFSSVIFYKKDQAVNVNNSKKLLTKPVISLDTVTYDKKINELANNPPDSVVFENVKTITKDKNGKNITKITKVLVSPQPIRVHLWPVKTIYPNPGAILPFNRIVAYYGNLYSNKMGVLGEYPEAEMLQKLEIEVKKWKEADPLTPVIPALHYIAVVAQNSPGDDSKYRFRMPNLEIDKVLTMAEKINAIVFLDFQVGFSTLDKELSQYEKYFKLPNVHLGIDPEFSMKGNIRPGKIVGTYDAVDINFASDYLAKIVKENNLTPKILIIHRYTQKMITNYKQIKTLPEVQIVMNMDGWGDIAKKISTYKNFIYSEPIQFTGFKLFYKNDTFETGTTLMTPNDLLKLNPRPIYIQYQ